MQHLKDKIKALETRLTNITAHHKAECVCKHCNAAFFSSHYETLLDYNGLAGTGDLEYLKEIEENVDAAMLELTVPEKLQNILSPYAPGFGNPSEQLEDAGIEAAVTMAIEQMLEGRKGA